MMKKLTTILLLLLFVLLFILMVFSPTTYPEETMPIIGVYNHDNATYQMNIIVNGQNNSYALQPNGDIYIPREDSKISTYKIEMFIDGNLEYSDILNLPTYETLLCSIKYGKLDAGVVAA